MYVYGQLFRTSQQIKKKLGAKKKKFSIASSSHAKNYMSKNSSDHLRSNLYKIEIN